MPIELRILDGARAGQGASFDQAIVTIGRHPTSDLRLDPNRDLEVSARHVEIRREAAGYALYDHESTNGTFVNGDRIPRGGSRALRDSDLVTLGVGGPRVTISITPQKRRRTTDRIAGAVRRQTRSLRVLLIGLSVVVGGLALGGWWMGMREGAGRDAEIKQLTMANEQASRDFAGVRQDNNAALVLITSYVNGRGVEATGFCITPSGYVVTSRHVVANGAARAAQIVAQFADTRETHRARLVALGSDTDSSGRPVDLALLQLDDAPAPGPTYPTVRGISSGVDARVGSPIATLGFPLGSDVSMEAQSRQLVATTTLTGGLISRSAPDLLQIDAFAGHGSSGSPVFDAHGQVIGVVWGGPPEARGRIVYAVPAARIMDLLPVEVRRALPPPR